MLTLFENYHRWLSVELTINPISGKLNEKYYFAKINGPNWNIDSLNFTLNSNKINPFKRYAFIILWLYFYDNSKNQLLYQNIKMMTYL